MNKSEKGRGNAPLKPATRLVNAGRDPSGHHGFVNTPVYHASTVLYASSEDYVAHRGRYSYGRRGTPTSEALCDAVADLEGPACEGVVILPSGLAAVSVALLAATQAGDHVLIADNAYLPTRKFCDTILARYGVAITYYDPLIGAGIESLLQPNTRAVYLESPGSLSFEVQDVPAIAAVAHRHGALVLMDNTWATPLYFRALDKGVDLSIQAGTKYIGGHSDLLIGTVAANAALWPRLHDTAFGMGLWTGPDDMFLALRGLRTLAVRLPAHQAAGLKVAAWLEQRPEILLVLHPALPTHPQHALWKRDFTGACGLFSIVFKPVPEATVHAFVNALTLFGIGASWGGFESLATAFDCSSFRTATTWNPGGPCVRLHIGLEDVDDLISDLERGFAAMTAS